MLPTLYNSQNVIVRSSNNVDYNDVVVVSVDDDINTLSGSLKDNELIVKRIIGKPGDYVIKAEGSITTKTGVDIRQPSGVESRVSVQFLKVSVTHKRSRTTALMSLPLQSCCASYNGMGLHIPENSMGRHTCQ